MIFIKRLLLLMVFALPLAACDNDGPAEELGENIDNAADDAGDAIHDAAKETKRAAEDACDAATDNNC
ncbi:MAG TPA: hypothetical protein VIC08_03490 [Cellvibrionaceae bacterium]